MWNFLCRLLNTLILHRVKLKKKSGYSINILDVQLIGEFHLDVLRHLSPSSSLQTASSFCGIIMVCASPCQQRLAYSCLDLWKPL
jgi:hypothetical protein